MTFFKYLDSIFIYALVLIYYDKYKTSQINYEDIPHSQNVRRTRNAGSSLANWDLVSRNKERIKLLLMDIGSTKHKDATLISCLKNENVAYLKVI